MSYWSRDRKCGECGATYREQRGGGSYCGRPCKTKAANREMIRGRELFRILYPAAEDDAPNMERARARIVVWRAEDESAGRSGPPRGRYPYR